MICRLKLEPYIVTMLKTIMGTLPPKKHPEPGWGKPGPQLRTRFRWAPDEPIRSAQGVDRQGGMGLDHRLQLLHSHLSRGAPQWNGLSRSKRTFQRAQPKEDRVSFG